MNRLSEGQGVELVGCGQGFVFYAAELALADHMHGLNAGDQDARAAKGLESKHRPHDAFDGTVVLLDNVVEVLGLPQLNAQIPVCLHAHDGRGVKGRPMSAKRSDSPQNEDLRYRPS